MQVIYRNIFDSASLHLQVLLDSLENVVRVYCGMRMVLPVHSSLDQNCVPAQVDRPQDVGFDVVSNHYRLFDWPCDGFQLFFCKIKRIRMRFAINLNLEILAINEFIHSFKALGKRFHQEAG